MTSAAGVRADRVRHRLRQQLACLPYLYDAAVVLRPSKRRDLVHRGSALLIEGFLRSGNTFSVAAFRVANPDSGHIASHLHAAAHVRRAVRLGVPSIVVIRQPRDAVVSYLIRRPTLTAGDALREYVMFYRAVWPVRDAVVIAPFDWVTTDFGQITRALNARFATTFAVYAPTAANEAAAFRLVEEMNRAECGGTVRETHVGRPSAVRRHRKEQLAALLDAPDVRMLRRDAERLHAAYVRRALRQGQLLEASRASGMQHPPPRPVTRQVRRQGRSRA